MSERVVPTKPGWWLVNISGNRLARPLHVVYVSNIDSRSDDLVCTEPGGSVSHVENSYFKWLAPVASPEAVAAAVEVLKGYGHAARLARDQQGVDEIKRAIAGLTGGEVQHG